MPLAKISRPRVQKVLKRWRLFRLLDKNLACRATWVCGPGGSGKTTLISSYIEEKQLPCLWYQIDESDSDIAAFFYYLGLAGTELGQEVKDLPLLTPEYAHGLSTFCRRFFEVLFDRFSTPGVLVLDNYQEAPSECLLHEAIRTAISVIPEGINLFVLSRTEPPPILARAVANNLLAEIGWSALRLQIQETRDLVRLLSRSPPSEKVIDSLQEKVDGWMAGLLLLLKRAETEAIDAEEVSRFTAQEVFDYFSSEIFDKADKETRVLLLRTSVLPTITEKMAQKLTGLDNAGQILFRIRHNHWFTERYPGQEIRYQYHPLFREYLLSQAAQTFSSEYLTRLKEEAARLLEADGQIEPAIELLFESGNPHRVVQLILSQAKIFVLQGRNQTLEQWLRRLPEEVFCKYPYAVYRLGVCRHRVDPDEGRDLFEKAYSLFEDQQDTVGMCLSLCGIFASITFAWGSFKPLDQWIPKLAWFSQEYEVLPSAKIQAKLCANTLFALTFRQPNHSEFKTWEKRSQRLLQENIPGDIKLRIIVALAWQRLFLGDLSEAWYFIEMYREMIQSANVPGFALFALKNLEAFYYFLVNNFGKCSKMVAEALDLASATGIHFTSPIVLGHGAAGALSAGDLHSADTKLWNMSRYAHYADWLFIYFRILKIWKALLEKDFSRALLEAESAKAYVAESGMPMTDAVWHQGMAIALHASGNLVEASSYLDQALDISSQIEYRQVEFGCYLTQAELHLDASQEDAACCSLQEAMAIGKEQRYINTWLWRSDAMARLCCKALEADIEVDYVQDLILRRNLFPETPPLEIQNWPWRIRIYTLGGFALLKYGKPLSFSKKVQEKPLAMLKAIVVLGGCSVSDDQLADLLWPDADGDAAHGAFKTNLHRLRKLLGSHEAIQHVQNKITLDPKYFWVDAWAFEHMIARADSAWGSAASEADLLKAADLTQRALELYKGKFLQFDDYISTPLQDYFHYRFIQGVQQLGEYWQNREQLEEAICLYETALTKDELVEPFYRGLMLCRHQLGQKAKALAAFERCKKVLAKNLNASPSRKTDSLKKTLLNQ